MWWRYHWDKYGGRRSGRIFLDSVAGVEKWRAVVWGVVLLGLSVVSTPLANALMSTWQLLPWWVVPAFLLFSFLFLLVRGFLKASYEDIQQIESGKTQLQEMLATEEKRMALKDLLGEAREEGPRVYAAQEKGGLGRWASKTQNLIEAAFGKGEAQLFFSDEGYSAPPLLPYEEMGSEIAFGNHIRELEIGFRLRRLDSLILRADSLPIRPGFDPQCFAQQMGEPLVEQTDLVAVVEQGEIKNEQLEAENAQVTAERDASREENARHKTERDAQLQARCFWLSEKLRKFWEAWEQEDPQDQEMMQQYKDEFSGEVADVINTLKGFKWWNAQEDGHLEFPRSRQDIQLLDYRLRDLAHWHP